jgi:hypothetical protein
MLTKALIVDPKVPEVDSQIIRTNIRLSVGIDRNRIDMVRVGVGIDLSGDRRNDRIPRRHFRQFQPRSGRRRWSRSLSIVQVRLGDLLDRLLVHFPQLDGLV